MLCRPFISYAKENRETAERIYNDLRRLGAQPWMDNHELRGGQAWKPAIRQALRESTHVISILSEQSVSKTGYVQSEVRQALEQLETVPPERIFLIPVRIDDVRPHHERLADLHWIDLFPDYRKAIREIARSLELDSAQLATSDPLDGRRRRRLSIIRQLLRASRRASYWRYRVVAVNDFLEVWPKLVKRLEEAEIPIARFSERGAVAPSPINQVVTVGPGVGSTAVQQICELVYGLGTWYIRLSDDQYATERIYIGAYGYGGDMLAELTSELMPKIQHPQFTVSGLRQWISDFGVVLDADYPVEE